MTQPVRVLHYGLGPIGVRIARLAATRPNLMPIGAVDIDPDKVQQDLGQVAELPETLGVLVQPTLEAALQDAKPHIALHATGSHLPSVLQQFLDLADAALPTVSTCEELSYPWFHHPEEAQIIDQAAKRNGIAILGY